MTYPALADMVIVQHYWWDERTRNGVNASVTFTPKTIGSTGTITPNLTDAAEKAWIKTRAWKVTPDGMTGYLAVPLTPNDDPDLTAFGGYEVAPDGETARTVAIPSSAGTTTVTTQMQAALAKLSPPITVTVGATVKTVWLTDVATISNPPSPPNSFFTADQTQAAIAAGILAHDDDTSAHPDIRALIGSGGGGAPSGGAGGVLGGSYPNPSFAVDMATQSELDAVAASRLPTLVPTNTFTSGSHTPVSGEMARYAPTSNVSVTLPAAAASQRFGVANVLAATSTFTATFTCAGADTFSDGSTSLVLKPGERAVLIGTSGGFTVESRTVIGAGALAVRSVSSNTTAVAGELLKVDASGGTRTVTPPASPTSGTEVIVMKTDSSPNAVTWSGQVDGDAGGVQLVAQWAAASFVYDGTQWLLHSTNLAASAASQLTAVTTTKTANYTAAPGELVLADTSGGAFTITSPSGGPFAVRWKAGTTGPTVTAATGFTINGAASATLSLPPSTSSGELVVFQCFGADYQQVAGFKPQGALAAPLTGFVSNAGTTPGSVPVIKPSGDTRAGVWEYVHNSTTGYLFHLLQGASAGNPSALIACGNDNSDGMAILIANKANGKGLVIDQQPTVGGSGYGIHGTQRSATAPLLRLEAQATGAADVMQLLSFSSPAPSATQNLLYIGDPSGQAGVIYAANGEMEWRRNVHIMDKDGSTISYLEVTQNGGIATNQRTYWRQKALGTEVYSYSGSTGIWWPMQVSASGSTLSFNFGGTTTTLGTPGTLTSVLAMSNGKIGFFGATKVVQQTGMGAAATDAATTQTLVNNLRTALINLGLVTA